MYCTTIFNQCSTLTNYLKCSFFFFEEKNSLKINLLLLTQQYFDEIILVMLLNIQRLESEMRNRIQCNWRKKQLTSDWFRIVTVSIRFAFCNRLAIFLTHCFTFDISANPHISFNPERLCSTAWRYSNAVSKGCIADWIEMNY